MKKDYRAVVGAVLICFVIGFAYCWSIFEKALVLSWGWTNAQASLPYSLFMVFYACGMLFGGLARDRFGSHKVCFVGLLLLMTGLSMSAAAHSVLKISIGFGVFAGAGQAICYNCVISTPLKWVSDKKRGLITGITVGAVGLTGIYMSPLVNFFIEKKGVSAGFFTILIVVGVVAIPMSFWIKDPPRFNTKPSQDVVSHRLRWRQIFSNVRFWQIFLTSFSCSLYGQLIVGHIANIAYVQANWENGFYLTVLLSLFNCIGRFLCGALSDYISGSRLLSILYGISAVNILLFILYDSIISLIIGTAIVGIGYGSSHSILPRIIVDCFGTEHFGQYFGLVSISAGFAGAVGPLLAGYIIDINSTYLYAYFLSAICMAVASFTASRIQHRCIIVP